MGQLVVWNEEHIELERDLNIIWARLQKEGMTMVANYFWSDTRDGEEVVALRKAYDRGLLSKGELDKFYHQLGIYALHLSPQHYMVRIKAPAGVVTPSQLWCIAGLADKFTPGRPIHITARQDYELHGIAEENLGTVLLHLARAELTTCGAGGNTVRNVTCCPYSAFAQDAAFDITPYAQAVAHYFLRRREFRALPRKIKIGFEACEEDHARIAIQDIGIWGLRSSYGSSREFLVYVGGGLGGSPMTAQCLEPFTPEELLIPTCEAILRVFNQYGDRKNRSRARLKFLIKDWGIDSFRDKVLDARNSLSPVPLNVLRRNNSARLRPTQNFAAEPPPKNPAYWDWLQKAVIGANREYLSVRVQCRLGDITPAQMRQVASVAANKYAVEIRNTNDHNMLLLGVSSSQLPNVYAILQDAELVSFEEKSIRRCVGGSHCPSAITASRNLARELEDLLTTYAKNELVRRLKISVSGCPHGCSHHSIADIGLYGIARQMHGRTVPCYRLVVGGKTQRGRAFFAKPVATLPACRTAAAIEALVKAFLRDQKGDSFYEYVDQAGLDGIYNAVKDFEQIPPPTEHPEYYRDIGREEDFAIKARAGMHG